MRRRDDRAPRRWRAAAAPAGAIDWTRSQSAGPGDLDLHQPDRDLAYCFRAQAVMKLHVVTTPLLLTTSLRSRSVKLSISISAAVATPCSTSRGKMVRTSPAMYS